MREISWILETKRHLCLLAGAYVSGILLYFRTEAWTALLFLTGGSIGLALASHRRKKEAAVMAALAAVFCLAAFLRCGVQDRRYEEYLGNVQPQTEITLSGIVYKKEIKANSYLYYLKSFQFENLNFQNSKEENGLGRVLVYTSEDKIPIGSVVEVSGELESFPHAKNEGNFDLADYYKSQNITFRMFAGELTVRNESEWNFREMLYQIQKRISEVYEAELNDRDAGILGTLALGNQAMMEEEIEELYQGAGISHILAISGLHISILGYGLFRFLRKCRCPYWIAAGAGSSGVFVFALMSGMAVSARRALIMYLLMMGAQVIGKSYDSANALALAALVVLTLNPQALFQSGFQFSYLSLAALCISSSVMAKWKEKTRAVLEQTGGKNRDSREISGWRRRLRKHWESLKGNIMSGAVLQLFLLPLTAWHYYEVPLYSLFLNLLVIPLCSWLLGFGLLGGVTGIFFPEISKWMLIVCHLILVIYERSIGAVNLLPFSQVVTGKPETWFLLLYYVILILVCIRTVSGNMSGISGKWKLWRKMQENPGKSGFLLTVLVLGLLLFFPEKQFCRVDFLDVSQGDGIYLTDGKGTHLMIDGGSTDEKQVGKYRIRTFLKYHRVNQIDAWIVTHGDEDHCSGALELIRSGYPVKYLVLAEAMPESEARDNLLEAARENNTEVIWAGAGDSLMLEDCRMICLYPGKEEEGTDANALSQVWSFEKEGLSVLFTGDIGTGVEEKLVRDGITGEYVILKVAHHGSKTSSGEEFLKRISPEYAVISCGEDNLYGHPHKETLARLEEAGSTVLQTAERGQITISETRKGWGIRFPCENQEEREESALEE